jgi:hypothetical protein
MGKKFGTNSKAEEGRARKAESKEKEKQMTRSEKDKLEEKKWAEGIKDESKKREEEAKRLEKLIKKQEKKEIEDKEAQELAKYKLSGGKSKSNTNTPEPLFRSKSLNWTLSASSDGCNSSESIEKYSASNLDDALLLLESANISSNSLSNIEKHPERRMKAAFAAFEAREMPKIREENPSLKHSQLLERLHKMWKKSQENPFNQLHVAHNMTAEEQTEMIKADQDRTLDRLRTN